MRGVRMGTQPSVVGVDVRAALASCGSGNGSLGGVALLGCQPPGCARPVDAVVMLPRAVLVVVGIDLPGPTMRLEAPLEGIWKVDGWPLVRPGGPLNPATEALQAAASVADQLRARHAEALNIHTVLAVGPYVAEVSQPSTMADTNTLVLYPEQKTLLAAATAAGSSANAFTVEQAKALLNTLAPNRPAPTTAELSAEGFPDAVPPDVAMADTAVLQTIDAPVQVERRIPQQMGPWQQGEHQQKRGRFHRRKSQPAVSQPAVPQPVAQQPATPQQYQQHGSVRHASTHHGGQLRWLPITAATLLVMLVITGILMATRATAGHGSAESTAVRPASVAVDGVRFTNKARDTADDCSAHAFGPVQALLARGACSRLDRGVYEASSGGQPAAVSIAVLWFADAGTAQRFSARMKAPGSGGVTDMVSEGHGWRGGPPTFDGAAFALSTTGAQVRLTAAVWSAKASTPTDEALNKLADRALRLPM